MTPTQIGFEKEYSDGSGIEFAVRYDASDLVDQIEVFRVNSARFPVEQLDWVIECLQKIKSEIAPNEPS